MADHVEVLRQHGFHLLPVKKITSETSDTRSFTLAIPEDLRDLFGYRAGQFCTFRVPCGEGVEMRCYSMSSAPETDDDLTVTVKRVPGGLVSNWFHDEVAEGDVLEVSKPAGVFCAREGARPVIAFCGGSGITPVISITKSLLATTQRQIRLVYANRDRSSVIFDGDLRRLVERYPDRLQLRQHQDADAGFLRPVDIAGFVGDALDADFYICGPGPFMELVESALHSAGVHPSDISIERFGGEPDIASATEEADVLGDVPESVTVIIKRKKHVLTYRPGDTVLDTARLGGLHPPFSCEGGSCATCMAMVREGSVAMRYNGALTPEELEEGWVLTCQSVPTSRTLTIEYESF